MSWKTKAITFEELNEIYQNNKALVKKVRVKKLLCPKCGMDNGKIEFSNRVFYINPFTKKKEEIHTSKFDIDCKFCQSEIRIILKKN